VKSESISRLETPNWKDITQHDGHFVDELDSETRLHDFQEVLHPWLRLCAWAGLHLPSRPVKAACSQCSDCIEPATFLHQITSSLFNIELWKLIHPCIVIALFLFVTIQGAIGLASGSSQIASLSQSSSTSESSRLTIVESADLFSSATVACLYAAALYTFRCGDRNRGPYHTYLLSMFDILFERRHDCYLSSTRIEFFQTLSTRVVPAVILASVIMTTISITSSWKSVVQAQSIAGMLFLVMPVQVVAVFVTTVITTLFWVPLQAHIRSAIRLQQVFLESELFHQVESNIRHNGLLAKSVSPLPPSIHSPGRLSPPIIASPQPLASFASPSISSSGVSPSRIRPTRYSDMLRFGLECVRRNRTYLSRFFAESRVLFAATLLVLTYKYVHSSSFSSMLM
jgi:hypothetical protein